MDISESEKIENECRKVEKIIDLLALATSSLFGVIIVE